MRRHSWAVLRSSRRLIVVELAGPVFHVVRSGPRIDGWTPVAGPFRRKDKRFRLMPKGWEP